MKSTRSRTVRNKDPDAACVKYFASAGGRPSVQRNSGCRRSNLKCHEKVLEFERKRAEREEMETKRRASKEDAEEAKRDIKRAMTVQEQRDSSSGKGRVGEAETS